MEVLRRQPQRSSFIETQLPSYALSTRSQECIRNHPATTSKSEHSACQAPERLLRKSHDYVKKILTYWWTNRYLWAR